MAKVPLHYFVSENWPIWHNIVGVCINENQAVGGLFEVVILDTQLKWCVVSYNTWYFIHAHNLNTLASASTEWQNICPISVLYDWATGTHLHSLYLQWFFTCRWLGLSFVDIFKSRPRPPPFLFSSCSPPFLTLLIVIVFAVGHICDVITQKWAAWIRKSSHVLKESLSLTSIRDLEFLLLIDPCVFFWKAQQVSEPHCLSNHHV